MYDPKTKIQIFGCSTCGNGKKTPHRHCPKCDYEMDYQGSVWNYGKYYKVGYKCLKCGNEIIATNTVSRDRQIELGLHEYGNQGVINREFLRQQKEKATVLVV